PARQGPFELLDHELAMFLAERRCGLGEPPLVGSHHRLDGQGAEEAARRAEADPLEECGVLVHVSLPIGPGGEKAIPMRETAGRPGRPWWSPPQPAVLLAGRLARLIEGGFSRRRILRVRPWGPRPWRRRSAPGRSSPPRSSRP